MMSDLINRQDAIRAVANYLWHYPNEQYKNLNVFEIAESLAKDALFIVPSADRPKNMIRIDDVYRLIAGHSNYHGDSILSAFTCLVEGKDVKDIAPLDESADRLTGWIPVSERLPIPPTFCLVTTDGKHGDVIDIALYMSDGWHKASEVLAWMLLPEPYKEDGEV